MVERDYKGGNKPETNNIIGQHYKPPQGFCTRGVTYPVRCHICVRGTTMWIVGITVTRILIGQELFSRPPPVTLGYPQAREFVEWQGETQRLSPGERGLLRT